MALAPSKHLGGLSMAANETHVDSLPKTGLLLIGMGLGPFLIGVFSDLIEPLVNSNAVSLQYALCIAVFGNLWATIHYFVGARHAESDLKDTEEFNAALNSSDESSATATK